MVYLVDLKPRDDEVGLEAGAAGAGATVEAFEVLARVEREVVVVVWEVVVFELREERDVRVERDDGLVMIGLMSSSSSWSSSSSSSLSLDDEAGGSTTRDFVCLVVAREEEEEEVRDGRDDRG